MKKLAFFLAVMPLLVCCFSNISFSQTLVACVGNSITAGYGTSNSNTKAWPIQFGQLMGSGYQVRNFGVSGTTMLKNGTSPYWNTSEFTNAKNYNPQILIIGLGTNDAWYGNWDNHKNEFYNDYADMINQFRQGGRNPEIYVSLPPPIRDANQNGNLLNEVIPKIRSISANIGVQIIDFNGQLRQSAVLFPDGLHPNDQGAAVMAQMAFNAVTHGNGNSGLGGTYYLQNRNSGLYLDVQGGSSADGANILQWTGNNGPNQRFTLNHQGNGVYSIISVASGKSIDISGGGVNNNDNVIQWGFNGGSNQKYTFLNAGGGYYKIKALHSAKLLDVAGGSASAGGNVLQWDDNNQTNAQWRLVSGANARLDLASNNESKIASEAVNCYPNPATNRVNLTHVPFHSKVAIYDMMGRQILSTSSGENALVTIEISGFNKGAYFVQVENEAIKTFKLIKH